MDSVWSQFYAAVESQPEGKDVRHLFERIVRRIVSALTRGPRQDLQTLARRADRFVRNFGAAEASAEDLHQRLIGRMEMLVAICRVALTDEISNDVMRVVRSRVHAQRVLTALRHREIGLSALATELDIDVSQLRKLVDKLEEHELVETQKDDRTRWVRLTARGERAAVIDLEARELPESNLPAESAAAAESATVDIVALTTRIDDVTADMQRFMQTKSAMVRLGVSAKELDNLARKLGSAVEQASAIAPLAEIPANAGSIHSEF